MLSAVTEFRRWSARGGWHGKETLAPKVFESRCMLESARSLPLTVIFRMARRRHQNRTWKGPGEEGAGRGRGPERKGPGMIL